MDNLFVIHKLKELLAIDSPLGMHREMDEYLLHQAEELGFAARRLHKGGVLVELGGQGRPMVFVAHADTVGLMVRAILPDGTLEVHNVGGVPPFQTLHENVRIYPRKGGMYTGTVARRNPSIHLMTLEERDEPLNYHENVCVRLDENVESAEDTKSLGISIGDMVALEPRVVTTETGYIKSRFLDDKAACACLLGLMKAVSQGEITLGRKVYVLFTEYEELGGSGACGIPADVEDYIALDIGCVGPENASSEHKVTLIAMDAHFPYDLELTGGIADLCDKYEIPYVMDMMLPRYGSDANAVMAGSQDVRCALIGPGVIETHGYERTHEDSLRALCDLLGAIAKN